MSDLISRQAAIDYCYRLINVEHEQGSDEMNYGQERVYQTETILHHLEFMPSVQPRKGEWTRHFDGNEWYWYCSSCREQWYEEDLWMGGNSFPNFCPNCGCRMEEGEQK